MNPAVDATGKFSRLGQTQKNVIFLCQTFERVKNVPVRNVMVQSGTSIFMPLINYISTIPTDGQTKEELVSTARAKIDSVEVADLSINKMSLPLNICEYRFRSNLFQVKLPCHNILNSNLDIATCVSDGYWIMIKPIKSAMTISSNASCSTGRTRISITYHIQVSESGQSKALL
jgi:hypothetical protein